MNKQTLAVPCIGYDLAADFYEVPGSTDILLTFVGLGASKARNAEFIENLVVAAEMSALVIDFSGHGESPFEFATTRPAQHILEAVATFDWLRAQYPEHTISVMGTSYGGFMAAWLSRFRDFKKLVLRTPAIYLPQDLYSIQSDIDLAYTTNTYRPDADAVSQNPVFMYSPRFTGPTLVVIHGQDEDIPPATSDAYRKIFSAETYTATGFRHGMRDPANPREAFEPYIQHIAHWLR